MNKREINKLIKIDNLLLEYFGIPKRKENSDPIDMMIGTILSQNTNDNNSYKAFLNLKKEFPQWELLENAEINKIMETIKVAGLPKQKATAIKNFIKTIKNKFGELDLSEYSQMNELEAVKELSKIKGIGVKTASCLLLFSFKKNICPVDTHVHRTLNRIGLVNTNSPEKTFFIINENFPDNIAHRFHTNLIKLGRTHCVKNPKCGNCPLRKICKFEAKTKEKFNKTKDSFLLLDSI